MEAAPPEPHGVDEEADNVDVVVRDCDDVAVVVVAAELAIPAGVALLAANAANKGGIVSAFDRAEPRTREGAESNRRIALRNASL